MNIQNIDLPACHLKESWASCLLDFYLFCFVDMFRIGLDEGRPIYIYIYIYMSCIIDTSKYILFTL